METEREQNGLLKPLVNNPFPVPLLGDADLPLVQQVECRLDRGASLAPGRWVNGVALVPRGLDGGLQGFALHGASFWLGKWRAVNQKRPAACRRRWPIAYFTCTPRSPRLHALVEGGCT